VAEALLSVKQLTVAGGRNPHSPRLLRDVSMKVSPGEVVGIVGESVSGKSVLLAAILDLLRPPAGTVDGSVEFQGENVLEMSRDRLHRFRGDDVGFIGPNAHSLLNPLMPVGKQVVRYIRAHQKLDRHAARERAIGMFEAVGIPDPTRRFDAYPHELSGGMAQRVSISIGLVNRPRLLLADEPTFGLDVTIQAQVLELMMSLMREHLGAASVVIATRDLGIVANYADRVVNMSGGRVTAAGPVHEFFEHREPAR